MIGVFTLKKAYWVVVFSIPLPFITVSLWSFIHKRYGTVGMYLSRKEGINMRNSTPHFLQVTKFQKMKFIVFNFKQNEKGKTGIGGRWITLLISFTFDYF